MPPKMDHSAKKGQTNLFSFFKKSATPTSVTETDSTPNKQIFDEKPDSTVSQSKSTFALTPIAPESVDASVSSIKHSFSNQI